MLVGHNVSDCDCCVWVYLSLHPLWCLLANSQLYAFPGLPLPAALVIVITLFSAILCKLMKNECSKKKSCFYENGVKCFGNTLWKQASKISSINYGPEDWGVWEGWDGGGCRQKSGDSLQPDCLRDVCLCSDSTLSKVRRDAEAWGYESIVKHWTCKYEVLSWISGIRVEPWSVIARKWTPGP